MATTTANLNEYVTVLFDGESSTVNAPPSPEIGNWFGVKAVSAGGSGFGVTVDGNGYDIESIRGDGLNTAPQQTGFFLPYKFYRWHFLNDGSADAWFLTSGHTQIGEVWRYIGPGSLNLNAIAFTTIPLTFQPLFTEPAEYFQPNGAGGLTCLKRFAGTISGLHYIEYLSTANNQEGNIHIQLAAVAGTPTIIQANGFRDSFFTSRNGGQFFKSLELQYALLCQPGDQIRWEGITDVFTALTINVLVGSELVFNAA